MRLLETTEWSVEGDGDENCDSAKRKHRPPAAKFHDCSTTPHVPSVQDYLATKHWKLDLQQQEEKEEEEEGEEEKEEEGEEEIKEGEQQQQKKHSTNDPLISSPTTCTDRVEIHISDDEVDEVLFVAEEKNKSTCHYLPPMHSDTQVIYLIDVSAHIHDF